MGRNQRDMEKERAWQKRMGEAARSGMSIREFCRQRRLKESQFYWWQRRLKRCREERTLAGSEGSRRGASFALVSEEAGAADAGIELLLGDGRRLRIRKGVDEDTLRMVLQAVRPEGC